VAVGTGAGGRSVRGRLAAAVALTAGFYLVVLGVLAALVAAAIAPWVVLHHGNLWITVAAGGLALSVGSAARPRSVPFEAPGALLAREDAPRLDELVAAEARAAGERAPDEVYATLEANAGVADVSRRRRVLVVGLPLLRLLTVRQLQAVLAHEFGHYAGGDTKLGRWIAHTRAGIGRTVQALAQDDRFSARAVLVVFELYGRAFLRITNAISRRQELAADAAAVRRAGRDAQVAALRSVHAYGPAFDGYWRTEVVPVLQHGRRPPVTDGFARFAAAAPIRDAVGEQLRRELAAGRGDPYDSHPTLAERLAAAEGQPPGDPDDSPCAITLLADAAAIEGRALAPLVEGGGIEALRPVAWEDVGREVYAERVAGTARHFAGVLAGHTAGALADGAPGLEAMAEVVRRRDPRLDAEAAREAAVSALVAGLMHALWRAGWDIDAPPGEPVVCRRGTETIAPVGTVTGMASGELDAGEWRARCERLGIAGLSLEPEREAAATHS
jgi:heat shock protein HtpX